MECLRQQCLARPQGQRLAASQGRSAGRKRGPVSGRMQDLARGCTDGRRRGKGAGALVRLFCRSAKLTGSSVERGPEPCGKTT